MKIAIRDIPAEGLFTEGKVSALDYDLPTTEYQRWDTIEYRLMINVLGTECLASGGLWTELIASCARCLEPLPVKIRVESFIHSYDLSKSGESIDLTQEIREDILLALPFAPKCKLGADFRCPLTGQTHREPDDQFAELHRKDVWGALENLKKGKRKK